MVNVVRTKVHSVVLGKLVPPKGPQRTDHDHGVKSQVSFLVVNFTIELVNTPLLPVPSETFLLQYWRGCLVFP